MHSRGTANSSASSKPAIVVLGDSFTFGMGVNDGEEYVSVMDSLLNEQYNVVNAGCGGWGITQEIRRFYDFGVHYSPKFVVIQFASNDPEDNLNYRVTRIENGKFVFENSNNSLNWLKKYLSTSIVQRSQLYNYFRERMYALMKDRHVDEVTQVIEAGFDGGPRPEEVFHNQLLELFARDLKERGIVLIMIAVNDALTNFPSIRRKVNELDSVGLLHYLEVKDWMKTDWLSVEGRHWNARAHAVIGRELARFVGEFEARQH